MRKIKDLSILRATRRFADTSTGRHTMALATAMLMGRDNEAEAVIRSAGVSMGAAALNMFRSRRDPGNDNQAGRNSSHGFRGDKKDAPVTEESFLKFQKKYFTHLKKQHKREVNYTNSLKKEDRNLQEANLERREKKKQDRKNSLNLAGAGAGGAGGAAGIGKGTPPPDNTLASILGGAAGAAVALGVAMTKFTGNVIGNVIKGAQNVLGGKPPAGGPELRAFRTPQVGETMVRGGVKYTWTESFLGKNSYHAWTPDPPDRPAAAASTPVRPETSAAGEPVKSPNAVAERVQASQDAINRIGNPEAVAERIRGGSQTAIDRMAQGAPESPNPRKLGGADPSMRLRNPRGGVRSLPVQARVDSMLLGPSDPIGRITPGAPLAEGAPEGSAQKENVKHRMLRKAANVAKFGAINVGLAAPIELALLWNDIESEAEAAASDNAVSPAKFEEMMKVAIKRQIETHIGSFVGAVTGGMAAGAAVGLLFGGVGLVPGLIVGGVGAYAGSVAGAEYLGPIVTKLAGDETEPMANAMYRAMFSEDSEELGDIIERLRLNVELSLKRRHVLEADRLDRSKALGGRNAYNLSDDEQNLARIATEEARKDILIIQEKIKDVDAKLRDHRDKRNGAVTVKLPPIAPTSSEELSEEAAQWVAGLGLPRAGANPVESSASIVQVPTLPPLPPEKPSRPVTMLPVQNVPGTTTVNTVQTKKTTTPAPPKSRPPKPPPTSIQTRNPDKSLKSALTNTHFMTEPIY